MKRRSDTGEKSWRNFNRADFRSKYSAHKKVFPLTPFSIGDESCAFVMKHVELLRKLAKETIARQTYNKTSRNGFKSLTRSMLTEGALIATVASMVFPPEAYTTGRKS